MDLDSKKTQPYVARPSGIYGKISDYIGCHENQGRKSLHEHSVVISDSLSPALLEKIAAYPELRAIAIEVVLQYIRIFNNFFLVNYCYFT